MSKRPIMDWSPCNWKEAPKGFFRVTNYSNKSGLSLELFSTIYTICLLLTAEWNLMGKHDIVESWLFWTSRLLQTFLNVCNNVTICCYWRNLMYRELRWQIIGFSLLLKVSIVQMPFHSESLNFGSVVVYPFFYENTC